MDKKEQRKKLVAALVEGLKEGNERGEEIERERFARSLGAAGGSKLIEGDLVPVPDLSDDD